VPAPAIVLAAFSAACIPASSALAAARWPRRCPAAAILLWQALGLGWGLAAVGALAALGAADARSGVAGGSFALISRVLHIGNGVALRRLLAWTMGLRLLALTAGLLLLLLLCWILVAAFAAVLRARRRQRMLLSLLAHGDPKVPGALVVDHPAATAYCVPGLRSRIVFSAGALDLLDQAELAAVLAHERAHLRERHDLVLLPFAALLRAFRWSAVARQAAAAVSLLVEMLADDRALRHRPARELATALLRVGSSGWVHAPAGALAAADGEVAARVSRLLRPDPRLPVAVLTLVAVAAVAAVAVPAALLTMPF
jgi:beta-lactamase regulating signal transducer with metallopeptidase domain